MSTLAEQDQLLNAQQSKLEQADNQIESLTSLISFLKENEDSLQLLSESVEELKVKEERIKTLTNQLNQYRGLMETVIHFKDSFDPQLIEGIQQLYSIEPIQQEQQGQKPVLQQEELMQLDDQEDLHTENNEAFIEETAELVGALMVAPVIEKSILESDSGLEYLEYTDQCIEDSDGDSDGDSNSSITEDESTSDSNDLNDLNEEGVLSAEEAKESFFNYEWFGTGPKWDNLELRVEEGGQGSQGYFSNDPDSLYPLETKQQEGETFYRLSKE